MEILDLHTPNEALEPDKRVAGCADDQNGQRKPRRRRSKRNKANRNPHFCRYIADVFSSNIIIIIIITIGVVWVPLLQSDVEGCNNTELHGILSLVIAANKGTIDYLEQKTEDYKTRLSEMGSKYNLLQDECRNEKEQLNQMNQAQTETIEETKKEIYDLKKKMNERDDAYEKQKQENDKCHHSESKMKQKIHDLSVKLQATEKRLDDQMKESGYGGIMIIVAIVFGLIACSGHFK